MTPTTPPLPLPGGQRRLAAIVFTDVVGYSSRMQHDETGTLALVQADYALMCDRCTHHGGELLNSMGDGLLLCFPSAVQAVACALQIQAEFGQRRNTLPAAEALEHRVGVHIGDVFRQEAGGVAGDGVNIAARLQTKAPPGGICISQTVHDTVKGKVPMQAVFIGPEAFKNITEPIPIWHIVSAGAPAPARPARAMRSGPRRTSLLVAGALAVAGVVASQWPSRPVEPAPTQTPTPPPPVATPVPLNDKSLVVLPFENLSPDPENAFFTDGMHSEIIATLSRLSDLKVIQRGSALAFKTAGLPVAEFARKVGAANALTGSVRRADGKIRIVLELRHARDEALLWTQTYERELRDTAVFALQSAIAAEVSRVLQVRSANHRDAAQLMTANAQAYDLYLKCFALEAGLRGNKAAEAVLGFLEGAVALDANFVPAVSALSQAHAQMYLRMPNTAERLRHGAEAKRLAELAARLMPGGMGDTAFSYYYAVVERDGHRSLAFAENAVRALPNDVASLSHLGTALHFVGRVPEALTTYQRARALDPLAPGLIANELEVLAFLRRPGEFARLADDNRALVSRALAPARLANLRFTASGELPAALDEIPPLGRLDFLWRARQFAEALELIDRALAAPQVAEAGRATVLERKHDVLRRLQRADEAAAVARELLPLTEKLTARPARDTSTNDPPLFRALARAGRADEAVALARRYVDRMSPAQQPADRWHRETRLAELYAELARPRECVEVLTRLLRVPGGLTVPMLRVSPDWDNVRDDPGFKALLADPKNSAPL